MVKIVDKDNPILRTISSNVDLSIIKKEKIQKILNDMHTALNKEDDGVALAAPQIGIALRIFIVSPKAYTIEPKKNPKEKHLIFINPKIIKISKDKKAVEEGCLSVRWLYGKTKRATKTTIRAYDENGNEFEQEGSGIIAQIFQHEIEHLDGILFIDHAKHIKNIPPIEIERIKKENAK